MCHHKSLVFWIPLLVQLLAILDLSNYTVMNDNQIGVISPTNSLMHKKIAICSKKLNMPIQSQGNHISPRELVYSDISKGNHSSPR
jgi:hypothetical protein